MAQEIKEQIDLRGTLQLAFIALVFLLFSRLVTLIQYVRSAKHQSSMFMRAAWKNEFAWGNLGTDIAISFVCGLLAEILVPAETKRFACLLLVALSNSFRRRSHEPAIGLAWSFYFGYLKKVLPKFDGNINRSKHKDETLPKLFVLVPEDCKIHGSLADADSRITFAENLQPHQENVAGIQERRYIHSSYKIEDPNFGKFYVALEYATPLNTLKDMCANSKAEFTEAERDQQALLFYDTIKDIIDNCSEQDTPVIKSRVEFVFLPRNANVVDTILEAAQLMAKRGEVPPPKKQQ